jgi:hypothetical protein
LTGGSSPQDPAPVSWFVIERGWKVVASDGSEVGTIEETVGDSSHDIFDGLTVKTSRFDRPRYVPSEQVGTIRPGVVALKLSAEQAGKLGAYDTPAVSEEILPVGGSWWTRLLDSFRRPRT